MLDNLVTFQISDLEKALRIISLGNYNLMSDKDFEDLKKLPGSLKARVVANICSSYDIATICPECIQQEIANIAIDKDKLINQLYNCI